MKNIIEILVVGTHAQILKTIARLIDNNEKWHATLAHNLGEAAAIFKAQKTDLILIGAGLMDEEEKQLTAQAKLYNLPIVKHYGGGSGLLFAEIHEAMRHAS